MTYPAIETMGQTLENLYKGHEGLYDAIHEAKKGLYPTMEKNGFHPHILKTLENDISNGMKALDMISEGIDLIKGLAGWKLRKG